MSESRSRILDKLRRGLGRESLPEAEQQALWERLASPQRNIVPQRAQPSPERRIESFVQMAEEASASVARLSGYDGLAQEIARYLSAHGLPPVLVTGESPILSGLDWEAAQLRQQRRVAAAGDTAAASVAFAGIAETGTLMLLSGAENPSTLNFLPDSHLVVLSAADIVGSYEEAWTRLRATHQRLPRTVNMITGPSRSADIEQKLQMGAHGPIRLHILLVASAPPGESGSSIDV